VKRVLAIALVSLFLTAAADDPSEYLADPVKEARAKALFEEIRCVVCQNESIAGSDADIAHDVRTLVREQIAAGASDKDVRLYLLGRYGEFILLRPRLSLRNTILWGAPFAIVIIGLGLILRRRPTIVADASVDQELSADEQKALKQLQENSDNDRAK